MAYSPPSLFGVAYASRLFREIDDPSSYQELVSKTLPMLDLGNSSHCAELLKWLNKWGCRIAEGRFVDLSSRLGEWLPRQELPSLEDEIAGLGDSGLDQLTTAYEGLRDCEFGPTGAAKTLFGLRPRCAIPWDEPIRTEFRLPDDGAGYREMLKFSRQEAQGLLMDANRCGIEDITKTVGSPPYVTVAKLLDEYHWITITSGHHIPSRPELEVWVSWLPK